MSTWQDQRFNSRPQSSGWYLGLSTDRKHQYSLPGALRIRVSSSGPISEKNRAVIICGCLCSRWLERSVRFPDQGRDYLIWDRSLRYPQPYGLSMTLRYLIVKTENYNATKRDGYTTALKMTHETKHQKVFADKSEAEIDVRYVFSIMFQNKYH